jgi:putative endonuclease
MPTSDGARRRRLHFVYIARCGDGTLYTGYARDPMARLQAHNRGTGARYTASRRPVTLEYTEPCRNRSAALKREYQIKQLSRAAKERLIAASAACLPR